MKFFYNARYRVDIGAHVFPVNKYERVAQKLHQAIPPTAALFYESAPAEDKEILRVHTKAYVHKLKTGTLSPGEIAALELPWSPALVEASWICAGGTIQACRHAIKEGAVVHIGGGFHHAFADHGEGFCVLNDIAIGIRCAQAERTIRKALVVDLDVHHGNGTAAIFSGDTDVFTFSMHQLNNYPAFKPHGSLDIDLEDGCSDADYLLLLENALAKIGKRFKPDLMIYVAGADAYQQDQLGGLGLTLEGMRRRDNVVFDHAQKHGIPVVGVLAGGYAIHPEDTVAIHFEMAAEAFRRWG